MKKGGSLVGGTITEAVQRAISEETGLSWEGWFRSFAGLPNAIHSVNSKPSLSLRNFEDLLHEFGIDVSYEAVRFWWNRFGPMFAAEIRKQQVSRMRSYSNWQWHLDEVFVKINGETHHLWWAVDYEGEVLESYVTKRRHRKAAMKLLGKTMKRFGRPHVMVTDLLRSYGATM